MTERIDDTPKRYSNYHNYISKVYLKAPIEVFVKLMYHHYNKQ